MIRHKKTTPKADGNDAGRVQPSDWNDVHDIDGMLGELDKLAVLPGIPYIKDDGTPGVAALSAAGRDLIAAANYLALLASLGAAPIDSPNFQNNPRATTPALTDISTRIATTEFVQALIASFVGSAPATLDTLYELAQALGNDPSFATTVATALGNRLRVDAAQGLTSTQRGFAVANLALEYADLINKPGIVRFDATQSLTGGQRDQALNNIGVTYRFVTPYTFGAIGDGVADDRAALQSMIDYVEANNCEGIIPAATFYTSGNLRTSHAAQGDYIASAWRSPRITGMGRRSIIMGPHYVTPAAADYSDADTASMGDQAILSIYRSNCVFSNFALHGGKVGIFLGQDPAQASQCSYAMYNVLENFWMEKVGTGVLMQCGLVTPDGGAGGVYYNKLRNFHMTNYQIGVHLAPWIWGINNGYPNTGDNNRNTFQSFRGQRGWVNYLVESGDGNDFVSCFSENGTYAVDGANFVGAQPAVAASWFGGDTAAAYLFVGAAASNNHVYGGTIEACDRHIYDVGYKNDFLSVACDPSLCNFVAGNPADRGTRILPGGTSFGDTLSAATTFKVGGGQAISFVGGGAVTAVVGNVGAGATVAAAAAISVPGSKVGDTCVVTAGNSQPVTYVGHVDAPDVVTIDAVNSTSATVNVTSQKLRCVVFRF